MTFAKSLALAEQEPTDARLAEIETTVGRGRAALARLNPPATDKQRAFLRRLMREQRATPGDARYDPENPALIKADAAEAIDGLKARWRRAWRPGDESERLSV